jgi:OOP family OmpA-OmpF porin
MMKKLSLLATAAFLAACATQEPPKPAAQPAPAPAPAPAPEAKPEPAPVAKPAPKPVAEKVTFNADVLFDFDKATLKPEGRAKNRRVEIEVIGTRRP